MIEFLIRDAARKFIGSEEMHEAEERARRPSLGALVVSKAAQEARESSKVIEKKREMVAKKAKAARRRAGRQGSTHYAATPWPLHPMSGATLRQHPGDLLVLVTWGTTFQR